MEQIPFTSFLSFSEVLTRLGAAAGLAALLGIDREVRGKAVGLRSFMLVALGAAAFSLVTLELIVSMQESEALAMDPSRVVEGIIGGIGFLGAGAIIQRQQRVHGVTTGASIWVVGAIGMACGFGFYVQAATIAVIAAIILTVLGLVERVLFPDKLERDRKEESA